MIITVAQYIRVKVFILYPAAHLSSSNFIPNRIETMKDRIHKWHYNN